MHSGLWFLMVGASAATVHTAVFVLALLLFPDLWPEVANVAGFLAAFSVSFFGHRYLSFQDAGTDLMKSLLRFVATALTGFVTNEVIFVMLFRWASLPLVGAVIGGLIVAAIQTFVLSRFWAFKR